MFTSYLKPSEISFALLFSNPHSLHSLFFLSIFLPETFLSNPLRLSESSCATNLNLSRNSSGMSSSSSIFRGDRSSNLSRDMGSSHWSICYRSYRRIPYARVIVVGSKTHTTCFRPVQWFEEVQLFRPHPSKYAYTFIPYNICI